MAREPVTRSNAEFTLQLSLVAMKKSKEIPDDFVPTKDQKNMLLSYLINRENHAYLTSLKHIANK